MQLCHRFPVLPFLLNQLRSLDDLAQITGSLLHILGYAMKDAVSIEALEVIVPHMLSSASFTPKIAQYVFYTSIMREDEGFRENLPPTLKALFDMCATNVGCIKFRRRIEVLYECWDPSNPSRLDVLCALRLRDAPKGQTFENFEDFRPDPVFIAEVRDAIEREMKTQWGENFGESVEKAEDATPAPSRALCQRKFDPLGSEHMLDLNPRDLIHSRKRREFVVVASFIDKAPNLAGLCRTCEVFNARALCLPNKTMLHDPNFTGMTVTAEKWLPMWDVPPEDVVSLLRKLRKEGYTIVGLEQTHQSVLLGQYSFPEKTCLLLGAEKEGIRADIIPECDVCVEIPQEGNIRSLNVHVSGAMCVWEIARQLRGG